MGYGSMLNLQSTHLEALFTQETMMTRPRWLIQVLILTVAFLRLDAFAPPSPSLRRRVAPRAQAADDESEDELLERIIAEGSARKALEGAQPVDAASPPPKHRDPVANSGALTDRFVMAARALRGEYDPAEAAADTEEESKLLGALVDAYPAPYSFTAVGKPKTPGDYRDLADGLVRTVSAACDGAFVEYAVTPRLGGKFASVKLDTTVLGPEMVAAVIDALKADDRVTMAF